MNNEQQYIAAQAALIASVREDERPSPADPVDWSQIRAVLVWLIPASAWMAWGLFMLIPTLSGAHDASLFTPAENLMFCGAALVLCMAASVALSRRHMVRMTAFVVGAYVFCYWF